MAKTGSAKGVPKPKKNLDTGFSGRLKAAMKHGGFTSVPDLARATHCTRQALYPYFSGGKSQIDVFLLFALAEACNVSVKWLFTGQGLMGRFRAITANESAILDLFHALPDPLKDAWVSQGQFLLKLAPPAPSTKFPFNLVKKAWRYFFVLGGNIC